MNCPHHLTAIEFFSQKINQIRAFPIFFGTKAAFGRGRHGSMTSRTLLLAMVARGGPSRAPPWVHSQEVAFTVRGEWMSLKPVPPKNRQVACEYRQVVCKYRQAVCEYSVVVCEYRHVVCEYRQVVCECRQVVCDYRRVVCEYRQSCMRG